jgi:uncharacterized membrane protein YphA (DoxX/SURF4 family)
MTLQQPSKPMHIALWTAQVLLAATLIWSGSVKLARPVAELAAMWPWAGEVPVAVVKLTAVVDLLGAIGLIFPALFRIQPKLTPVAALGIVVLMICAAVFHIARGEASSIGVNVVVGAIALFIAWGRFRKAPIQAKIPR